MASIVDKDFFDAYLDPANDDEFWKKRIGYGKISKHVKNFLRLGGESDDIVDARRMRHSESKTYFSGHIHASFHALLYASLPVQLDDPGKLLGHSLGSVSENMVLLCMFLAEEVDLFAYCFVTALESKAPPLAIAAALSVDESEHNNLDVVFEAADRLAGTLRENSSRLYKEHRTLKEAWWAASDEEDHGASS
jgi:hypothetical protein